MLVERFFLFLQYFFAIIFIFVD